jgi:hypothetical protein
MWKFANEDSSIMLENAPSNQPIHDGPAKFLDDQAHFSLPNFNPLIFDSRNDETCSIITVTAKNTKIMTPEDLQRQFLDEQEKFDAMNVEQVAVYLREERKKKKFSQILEQENQEVLGIDQLLAGLSLTELENSGAFSFD